MTSSGVLVVAGTHGNEVNAPWLLQQWRANPVLIDAAGLPVQKVIGNPEAFRRRRRYIDRDLNRCFLPDLVECETSGLEFQRARELLRLHGADGENPCAVVIDLHSTTAAMGNSLVVYGRRPADLAFAALVQGALGLPIYLHEADPEQTGFLVESWPCGLVIEVGPVPQGVLNARIVEQTRLGLQMCLRSLEHALQGEARLPDALVVHRHLGSRDLPKSDNGEPQALIHPELQGRDWHDIDPAQAMFRAADGSDRGEEWVAGEIPVFLNEAAYAEKSIAFSLTRREVWPVEVTWLQALQQLIRAA
ncbi:aspartoacylase [Synechococcus sp. KORDI-52]|uniref:aspartoacylase n=1 Tax=Synechococcus sp. KORDI-52 TaxID=585425 RepID=UPI00056E9E84|nr:aspartoacylase [Synechococcus sp. KORDI-52]